ncbi:MAG: sigma-70 family RNA polymerase sigma factor [Myxococcales bacterium]|nr:sigma-70 family RNA polymerase sigma factor [Myxococcales bacterium]
MEERESDARSWLSALLAARGDASIEAARGEEAEALAGLLLEVVSQGREAWPEIALSSDAFVAHLAGLLPPEEPLVTALGELRAADLFLAWACAEGDAVAIAIFEETFGGELRIVRARLRRPEAESEDFVQQCRQRLLAPPRPKLRDYAGRGDLRHWLRVTLLRLLIDYQRSQKQRDRREVVADDLDGDGLALQPSADDPEMQYLKRHYGDAFRQAFAQAAKSLPAEDRNLLRLHVAQGLSIDQLAGLFQIHRATAARRVARARGALLSGVRSRLMDELGLGRAELDSVMRLIESNVHVSVQRLLGTEPDQRTP